MSSGGRQDTIDDRSSRARIRDAAIECIAVHGLADTTVRKVAAAADVSPALVMHHFGSMGQLRRECDEHVATMIRVQKTKAMAAGPQLDIVAALRDSDYGHAIGYLAAVLTDDSPIVAELVEELAADAADYMEQGVRSGMLRPTEHPRARATVMSLWSLGIVVLHHHMKRLLGVDITDPDVASDRRFVEGYVLPASELIGTGIYTDEFAARVRMTLASQGATPDDGSSNQEEREHAS